MPLSPSVEDAALSLHIQSSLEPVGVAESDVPGYACGFGAILPRMFRQPT